MKKNLLKYLVFILIYNIIIFLTIAICFYYIKKSIRDEFHDETNKTIEKIDKNNKIIEKIDKSIEELNKSTEDKNPPQSTPKKD